MRKVFSIVAILALCAFTMPATVSTSTGIEQTVGTTEDEYQFTDLTTSQTKEYTLTIRVSPDNAGTVQFAVGRAVVATDRASAPGETRMMTIKSGYRNLRAKGSTSGQKFTADY